MGNSAMVSAWRVRMSGCIESLGEASELAIENVDIQSSLSDDCSPSSTDYVLKQSEE